MEVTDDESSDSVGKTIGCDTESIHYVAQLPQQTMHDQTVTTQRSRISCGSAEPTDKGVAREKH